LQLRSSQDITSIELSLRNNTGKYGHIGIPVTFVNAKGNLNYM